MSFLLAMAVVVGVTIPLVMAWFLGRVSGARRIAVALLVLSSAYIVDVNLMMHERYRGMSRAFDIGSTDLLVAALIVYLFSQVRDRGLVWRPGRDVGPVTPVALLPGGIVALGAFVAMSALSMVGAREPLYSLMDLYKLLRGVAIFWVSANLVADDRTVRDLPLFLVLFVGVEMAFAALQHLGGVWWVHGTFEHKNSFALSMNMILPILLAEGLRGGGWRTLVILGYGAGVVGLVLSRSRFGWFTMVVAAGLVLVACVGFTVAQRDRRLLQRQFGVLALLTLLGASTLARSYDSILARWDEDAEVSMDFRHRNNEIAETLAREHPFGVGLNNYVRELDEPIGGLLDPVDKTVAHHLYNLVAAETGTLGLILLVGTIVTFLGMALRLAFQAVRPWSKTVAIGLGAGLLTAAMHSFGESDLLRRETYFIFCMLMGMLSAAHAREGLSGSNFLLRLAGETMRATRRGASAALLVVAGGVAALAPAEAQAAKPEVTLYSARHVRLSFPARIEATQVPKAEAFALEGADAKVQRVGLRALAVGKVEDPWPPKAIMRYDLFLELDRPLPEDREVTLDTPAWLLVGKVPLRFTSLDASPAIKVSQAGFLPDDPHKAVFVGAWLGSLGAMKAPVESFEVVDLDARRVVHHGKAKLVAEQDRVYGEEIWRLPFGDLKEPGHYAVHVPGVGRSVDFRIGEVYDGPLTAVLRAFWHMRCGTAIDGAYTRYARPACHPPDQVACFTPELAETPLYAGEKAGECRDATGGWHDASDYGKYVPTAAVALYYLMVAWEAWPEVFPDGRHGIPQSGNGRSDLLDELAWELDWMLKMQTEDGGVYHKVTTRAWGTDKPPHENRATYDFAERTTHDTARLAAVMARAARVYAKVTPDAAKRYRAAAEKAWAFLKAHPKPVPDPGFENRPWNGGGGYGDRFGDDDERAWAAAEWIALTGEEGYDHYVVDKVPTPFNTRVPPLYVRDWPPQFEDCWRFAFHTYAQLTHATRHKALQAAIRDAWRVRTDSLEERAAEDPYGLSYRPAVGIPFGYGTSNGLRYASDAAMASVLIGMTPRRKEMALSNLGVLFGANGPGLSWVTGVGPRSVQQPEFRPNLFDGIEAPLPGQPVDGPANEVHSSNRDATKRMWPPPEDTPQGQMYFDMMDPVISEPTIDEMAQLVVALARWASAKTSPEGAPR